MMSFNKVNANSYTSSRHRFPKGQPINLTHEDYAGKNKSKPENVLSFRESIV